MAVNYKKLMILHVGCGPRLRVPVIGVLPGDTILPDNFLCLEVNEDKCLPIAYGHNGLVGVGEGGIHQVSHVLHVVALCPGVDIIKGEE